MTEKQIEKYNSNVVYKKEPLPQAEGCTHGINLACGFCGKFLITPMKQKGVTSSSCMMGYWVGASHWNRLMV